MGAVVKPVLVSLAANDSIYTKHPDDIDGLPTSVQNELSALSIETDAFSVTPRAFVVSELLTNKANNPNAFNSTQYQYAGAQYHRLGRGFLGFAARRTISARGTESVSVHRQDFPFTGGVKRQLSNVGNTILSQSDVTYVQGTSSGGQTTVHQDTVETSSFELNGKQYRYTFSDTDYDTNGNATSQYSWVGPTPLALQKVQEVNTTLVYKPPVYSTWFISQLETNTQTVNKVDDPNQPPITNVTGFGYTINEGVLNLVNREPNVSEDELKLTTNYRFDGVGNVDQVTTTSYGEQAHSRVEEIGYDTNRRLAVSYKNALDQIASISHHPICDAPLDAYDINNSPLDLSNTTNHKTIYGYDDFCRVVSVDSPIVSGALSTINYGNDVCPTGVCQVPSVLSVTQQIPGEQPLKTYLNHYSQTLGQSSLGMNDEPIHQSNHYDDFGKTTQSSQPYFAGETVHWTQYQYDAIDRTEKVTLPYAGLNNVDSASTNYTYDVDLARGLVKRTSYNTLNHPKTVYANAVGQVVEIVDALTNPMQYFYDSQGNLVKTNDVANTSIELEYDLIGRRTKLNDPSLGESTYEYTGFGEIHTSTDAKLQAITTVFDKLSRPIEQRVPNAEFSTVDLNEWEYDTAINGKGQLASITGGLGTTQAVVYDTYGRIDTATSVVKGETFTQSMEYDGFGRLARRVYPESGAGNIFAVQYEYEKGYLNKILGEDASTGQCIEHWRADEYDALSRIKVDTIGGSVETSRVFKPGQNVLETIQTIVNGTTPQTVQNLSYTYDANNNVKSRADALLNVSESFTYDALERLRTYGTTANPKSVNYDAVGNITYKSDVGTYHYDDASRPHVLSKVTHALANGPVLPEFEVNWEWDGQVQLKPQNSLHNQNFSYDANGNTTQMGNKHLFWTAFDKPYLMLLDKGNGERIGSKIEYDANFNRVYKEEGIYNNLNTKVSTKEKTIYVGTDYEKVTQYESTGTQVLHRYTISTGANVIQIEREDGSSIDKPKYMLSDVLGSTNVILDNQLNVEQRLAFDPWGMRMNVGDSSAVNKITTRGYTGHEMDDELGLINMNARVYDPYLARFLSADPVLPDAFDMQSFNRYSYVEGNPLKYVDPTGNYKDVFGGCGAIAKGCAENPTLKPPGSFSPGDSAGGGWGGSGNAYGTGGRPWHNRTEEMDESAVTAEEEEEEEEEEDKDKDSEKGFRELNLLSYSVNNSGVLAYDNYTDSTSTTNAPDEQSSGDDDAGEITDPARNGPIRINRSTGLVYSYIIGCSGGCADSIAWYGFGTALLGFGTVSALAGQYYNVNSFGEWRANSKTGQYYRSNLSANGSTGRRVTRSAAAELFKKAVSRFGQAGALLELFGIYNGEVSPIKAGTNLGVGAAAVSIGGFPGILLLGVYIVGDIFGAWNQPLVGKPRYIPQSGRPSYARPPDIRDEPPQYGN